MKMKVGDLVGLKNLHESWGTLALVLRIHKTDWGTGQIHLLTSHGLSAIPWTKRDEYIVECNR